MSPLTAELFLCPACGAGFDPHTPCGGCGATLPLSTGRGAVAVPDFLAQWERSLPAQEVEAFYDVRPFPGYAPGDTAGSLLDRSRRSAFLDALDRAIPVDATVLDAGCGKGRFARLVRERLPDAEIWGLDVSRRMLQFVPEEVRRCAASITELPFPDSCFDAAYATESLEHAVDIPGAVAELCRVVRPGGRIVIIDKNAEQWGRLETPEWERWFGRKELERLLRRDCRTVHSNPISYWEDVDPDGLFLAWRATK